MKPPSLRVRVLTATVLPAILVALSLAAILLNRQAHSLDEAMQARARADARQLAGAAEFGIFAGSREALQALVQATHAGDPEIRAVAILDARGEPLAVSGPAPRIPTVSWDEQVFQRGDATVVVVPISRSRLAVDDIYSGSDPRAGSGPIDGFVVLELSRHHLDAERNRQLAIGVAITFAGSLLAAWLALGIARGVIRPLLHIGDVVHRIARGDLAARVKADPAAVMPGLEQGINSMAQRIGSAQEHLIQQIAAASHDLRQPLHALGLFVSRLAQLRHGPEVRPLVGHIDASVQALQDLLDTLLDMSKLDAGLVAAKPADFPLSVLFERLALEYGGPAEEKKVALRVRPTRLWLRTDPNLLARILMNFVSNALRYTHRGGVLVAARRRGNKAVIEVWDTGIGIAPEHLQDVFSEYVQIGNPERHHAKGLGLGLAICERLSRLLKLPLGVRSVPGRGSVFRIEVPLGLAGEIAPPPMPEALSSSRIDGTVVVIEDEADGSAGMVGLVAGWGFLVIGAGSSAAAIALCEQDGHTPDMLIADFRLASGEDGISAGLALRRRYGPIPVLLISADNDERLVAGAARRKFALFTKPVRPGRLRAVVQQMMAQARAPAEGEAAPP